MFHHRHKQRALGLITTLIALTVAIDVFLVLGPVISQETALLYAFIVAIGLSVAYMTYNYRHSHEHHVLVNTVTQIYLGTLLFLSGVAVLVLQAFLGFDPLDGYLVLGLLVLLLTFLSIAKFDAFLASETRRAFPMAQAPAPRKRSRT